MIILNIFVRSHFQLKFLKVIFAIAVIFLVAVGFGQDLTRVYGQINSEKPSLNKTVQSVPKPDRKPAKPEIKKANEVAGKSKVPDQQQSAVPEATDPKRSDVKSVNAPQLLTLVPGQITTIKLQEAPLQILVDRIGLNINESNPQSNNHNVYLVPLKTGIRRNLIIETTSGKVEFELQSISVDATKPVAFTREVEVKNQAVATRLKNQDQEISQLKENLAAKDREIAAFADKISQAGQAAQKLELKVQTAMLLGLAKSKKNRETRMNTQKTWEITNLYSTKTTDGKRNMEVYEIAFRGQGTGRLLDVKSDSGNPVFWQTEAGQPAGVQDEILVQGGGKVRIAIIEFISQPINKGLVFVTDSETINF